MLKCEGYLAWHQERCITSEADCTGLREGHGRLHGTLEFDSFEATPTFQIFSTGFLEPGFHCDASKAAMDAVNVDLDEMRARVDSTHSIITSRQRVEALRKRTADLDMCSTRTKSQLQLFIPSIIQNHPKLKTVNAHLQSSRPQSLLRSPLCAWTWVTCKKP